MSIKMGGKTYLRISAWVLVGSVILSSGELTLASGLPEHHDPYLRRAKIFLAAGDYRRALQACEQQVTEFPSVESYVYLTYVYFALDGYLSWLAKQDEWMKVQQLALSLVSRGGIDLLDPPNPLPRMAKELLHEGIRQHFDFTAAMANRLGKTTVDRLWKEQASWQTSRPNNWWASVPDSWGW